MRVHGFVGTPGNPCDVNGCLLAEDDPIHEAGDFTKHVGDHRGFTGTWSPHCGDCIAEGRGVDAAVEIVAARLMPSPDSECYYRLALIRDAWADVETHLREHPIGGGLAARLDILATRIVG